MTRGHPVGRLGVRNGILRLRRLRFLETVILSTPSPSILLSFRNGNRSRHSCMALLEISRSIFSIATVWPRPQAFEWTWLTRIQEMQAPVNCGVFHRRAAPESRGRVPLHETGEGNSPEKGSLSAFGTPGQAMDLEIASPFRIPLVGDVSPKRGPCTVSTTHHRPEQRLTLASCL